MTSEYRIVTHDGKTASTSTYRTLKAAEDAAEHVTTPYGTRVTYAIEQRDDSEWSES